MNAFRLDQMPNLPGSYEGRQRALIEQYRAEALAAGPLAEPAEYLDLPDLPTGPWNKRLTCGHIVRDNCGGCGQYR